MRKPLFLRGLRTLIFAVLAAGTVTSCQNEKPEIVFPDPITPQKEFKHFEAYTPDTLNVDEGQTAQVRFRTIPWNLVQRTGIELSILQSDTTEYRYAQLAGKPALQKDSTWIVEIALLLKPNLENNTGDVIHIALSDSDSFFMSEPMTVNIIPAPVPIDPELHRASPEISGFEIGSTANIRFRTEPWNLLIGADSTFVIAITDTLGHDTDAFITSEYELQQDSTWLIKVKPSKSTIREAYGKVRLTMPDGVLLSETFTIKRVSFAIDKAYLLGWEFGPDKSSPNVMNFNSAEQTFYAVRPDVTDFTKQRVRFYHNGDRITLGDSAIESRTTKYNVLDLTEPVTVTLWKYDLHKDYTIRVSNTGLPIVRITTPKAITSRDVWTENCIMKIELPDGTVVYDDTLSIKGRGNGTWTESEKKPYALKLDEKAKILGMHKHKRWILLANYKDYTLLRNDAALWLARKADNMPYTISGRYVELVMNGSVRGNYYLCEQAKIDNKRIDIDKPNLDLPQEGGFLMEIDTYLEYDGNTDLGFWSSRYNLPWIFKDPDDGDGNSRTHDAYIYIKNRVNEMENVLASDTKVRNQEYRKYIDINTAIDFALIQELTMNHDSYNTWPEKGPHSTYLYMDKNHTDGKFCFGPVWDFDYHTFMPECREGNVDLAKQWAMLKTGAKTSSGTYYFERMLKDPEFKTALVNRWNELKYEFAGLPEYIDMMADSIRVSEEINRYIWYDKTTNTQNGDRGSFENAIRKMKQGFTNRWNWIDSNIRNL